tara:strand:+ start:171 stop:638 length:468 start_codon:yes stop_codon:yes gene_type:complete
MENIFIKKIKKNFYQLYLDEKTTKIPKFEIENVYVPFGLEEYNNKYVLNLELDVNSDVYKIIRKLEGNINEILNDNYEIKSNFHKKPKYNILLRTNIKKNDNMIITKYIIEDKEISIFDLLSKNKYNLHLEISGIWTFKNNAGLYINITQILKNN